MNRFFLVMGAALVGLAVTGAEALSRGGGGGGFGGSAGGGRSGGSFGGGRSGGGFIHGGSPGGSFHGTPAPSPAGGQPARPSSSGHAGIGHPPSATSTGPRQPITARPTTHDGGHGIAKNSSGGVPSGKANHKAHVSHPSPSKPSTSSGKGGSTNGQLPHGKPSLVSKPSNSKNGLPPTGKPAAGSATAKAAGGKPSAASASAKTPSGKPSAASASAKPPSGKRSAGSATAKTPGGSKNATANATGSGAAASGKGPGKDPQGGKNLTPAQLAKILGKVLALAEKVTDAALQLALLHLGQGQTLTPGEMNCLTSCLSNPTSGLSEAECGAIQDGLACMAAMGGDGGSGVADSAGAGASVEGDTGGATISAEDDPGGPTADVSAQTCRYLQVKNDTGAALTVYLQYKTQDDRGAWGWYPADPTQSDQCVAYELAAGEETCLDDGGWTVNASRVRIWAGAAGGDQWLDYQDKDLWLVPEVDDDGEHRYYAAGMETVPYVFTR
jgi:hypothetical protein